MEIAETTNVSSDDVDAVAATVVLLRDGADGPEVLLLERPSDRGSFAGGWVFPGGVVDASDVPDDQTVAAADPELAVAIVAAIRETWEETGLVVPASRLSATACWVPPTGIPKRVRTWFFLAPAPAGDIRLSPDESVGFAWMRPSDALDRHAAGTLRLFPPTWVTLHGLIGHESVDNAVAAARAGDIARFESRFSADRRTIYWAPDVAYADDALAAQSGPRHRLELGAMPWVYWKDPAV